ncbi:helix-turn-helix domain-containing protein [Lacrimispora indolis]|uniref:helix-turn-helix domain-containing protein n=1 Tax=Lacrimispora indolis TaxID=69825 RepID=UPI000422B218|nr:helix-turn-helix transcriptional regulator [[Clostridium] methoxybenzovorans]
MSSTKKQINEIVRGLREDRDLFQKDVAKALGMTQQQYSNYESGSSEFSARYIALLAGYFHVSTDYLF